MTTSSSFQWVRNPSPTTQVAAEFILPVEMRPDLSQVSHLSSIPIIDMKRQGVQDSLFSTELVEQISKACEEYGFFQIINHGVPVQLCSQMLEAVKELVELPPCEKAELYSEDPKKDGRIFSRQLKIPGRDGKDDHHDKVLMWSEAFYHSFGPNKEDFSAPLPRDSLRYREVMPGFGKEMSSLFTRLLSLISIGLGLDKDCLLERHGGNTHCRRFAQANYYPPCPNPELTLGLATHTDLNTLTILLQSDGSHGLQVIKDGKWVSVNPVPSSFVINIGDQLQVLTNGRYRSVHHRAVTNRDNLRVSIAMFYSPNVDAVIGPVDELIDEEHPPVYRTYRFGEFLEEFRRQDGIRRRVKEAFQLTPLD